jgi:outer membrane protein TolC
MSRFRSSLTFILAALAGAVPAAPAAAQTPPVRLALAEALRLAEAQSEALVISRAAESRADADLQRARSQWLPQVSMDGSYGRTLASEFSAAFDSDALPCAPLQVDPADPLDARVSELERAAACGALGPGFRLSELPFGQRNIYQVNFAFSQTVYAGGRIRAERTQAELGQRAASLGTASTSAALALDVTRAFYDAALADRLLAIAQLGFEQANAVLEQARLAFEAGRQPEFEVLRAQVARDNQQPQVIRRRADREMAYLRLRQLLDLPAGSEITLEADLDAAELPPPAPFADALAAIGTSDAPMQRTGITQAELVVQLREAAVRIAEAEGRPNVTITSLYGKVGYPSSGVWPSFDDFRTNWSINAAVRLPLFTGGRIRAGALVARADLSEAQARLQQTRELAELDAATARQDLAAAEAAWTASAGTVEQAERAYQIAELRYREGLSTQLELSDARLSLQVAQANRAQAARDVQTARARVALLPTLPVGAP